MNYYVFGKQVAIFTMSPVPQGGSIKHFTGSDLSRLNLPDSFYFQMPDKIAPAAQENISQQGTLVNTYLVSQELNIFSIFLGKCIWHGKLVDQFSEPYI
jgi:hypothetical protein